MYTVDIQLQTPSGRIGARRVNVRTSTHDMGVVIDKAHRKIKCLLSKGYKVTGGDIH